MRSFTGTGRVEIGSFAPPVALSVLGWAKSPIVTGAAARYVQNDTDTFLFMDSSTTFKFHRDWSVQAGVWTIDAAAHGLTLTDLFHFAICYDGASDANDPTFYANGVAKTVTRALAPSGTIWTTSGAWTIGNTHDGSLPLGGPLGRLSLHNVKLDAAEVLEHMARGFTPRGRISDHWLDGDSPEPDYSGAGHSGTVTGAASSNLNPPVILRGVDPFDVPIPAPAPLPPAPDPDPIPDEEEPPVDPPPSEEELPDPTPLPPVLDSVVLAIADLQAVRVEKVTALDAAIAGVSRLERDRAAADISFTDQAIRELVRAQNLVTRLGI